jgi:hypothetical protein
MGSQLPMGDVNELLCVSDKANCTQANRTGRMIAPKAIIGEAFVASAAWLCVAACDALSQREFTVANVGIVGANQQAIGARFQKTDIL